MKSKVIISTLGIIIALLAAGTGISVAWFTSSDFLRIDGVDIELSSKSDLYISLTDDIPSFTKNHLSYDELNKVKLFEPVSAMMSSNWMKEKAKYPQFYEGYEINHTQMYEQEDVKYALPTEVVADGGFFSQELYLYSESDYWAVIDTENTFIINNEDENISTARKLANETHRSFSEIKQELDTIRKTLRFSILVDSQELYDYKIIDPNKDSTTTFGGLLDTDLDGYYDVRRSLTDSSISYETLYGEVNDRSLIKYKEGPIEGEIIGTNTCFNAKHDITSKQIDLEASKANGLAIADEPSYSLSEYKELLTRFVDGKTTKEESDSLLLIPVKHQTPTRIVVSIYMEGWDIDTVNTNMAASFIANLSFGVIDGAIRR